MTVQTRALVRAERKMPHRSPHPTRTTVLGTVPFRVEVSRTAVEAIGQDRLEAMAEMLVTNLVNQAKDLDIEFKQVKQDGRVVVLSCRATPDGVIRVSVDLGQATLPDVVISGEEMKREMKKAHERRQPGRVGRGGI